MNAMYSLTQGNVCGHFVQEDSALIFQWINCMACEWSLIPGRPQVPSSGCRLLAWTWCIAVGCYVADIFRVEITDPSLTSDWSGGTDFPHIPSVTFLTGPNVIYAPTTLSGLIDYIPWNTDALSNSFFTFIVSAATCKNSFKHIGESGMFRPCHPTAVCGAKITKLHLICPCFKECCLLIW